MNTQQPKTGLTQLATVLLLVAFTVVATLAVNFVADKTETIRTSNLDTYKLNRLAEVLPADGYTNQPHLDTVVLTDEQQPDNSNTPMKVYLARSGDEVIAGVVSITAEKGYAGPIALLVGLNRQGNIIRVRTTNHRETPGLGDKIEPEKSAWIHQFEGADFAAASDWELRRNGGRFDHISGATITSQAVVQTVKRARQRMLAYLHTLDSLPAETASSP
jgi:electron transport complex protein RnfG